MQSQAAERLKEYRRKRDFTRTLEPSGADAAVEAGCLYVMHKHAASHDHFDLRLEQDGVLRSWALPKGASLEAGEKRLAVEVEDHPLDYGGFEGVIPEGEYGGGTVMLWDAGRWQVNGKNDEDHIDFILDGRKLKGAWTLVRTRGKKGGRAKPGKSWLLIKRSDRPKRRLEPGDESVATGRSMEEIARDRDNAWHDGGALEKPASPDAAEIEGARKKPFPKLLKPQLATLSDAAPDGDDWIHEIKFDGYRVMAYLENGKVTLRTRNGHDWTHRFPELAETLKAVPATRAILDGEVVSMLQDGSTSFRRLQEALSSRRTGGLVYQAFDLLYLDGYDLQGAALLARKQATAQLLRAATFSDGGRVRYSDHIHAQGAAFHEQACRLGLEGILSKRADAPYREGRGRQWLKVKCVLQQEFVVGGFTKPEGTRKGFRSLLLGAYDNGDFIYAGRVGTGFSRQQHDRLYGELAELEMPDSPFHGEVPDARDVRWVRPELVVEVEFTERTQGGRHRHPVFRGVRDDREPGEIALNGETRMRETLSADAARPAPRRSSADARVAGVRITHPDRVVYPAQGATKRDLALFYEDIQDWILPYLANRPLSLLRCPEGWQADCFFQKHPHRTIAKSVPRVSITGSKGPRDYVYVTSVSDIVELVQTGTMEFHPWGSQVDDIEHPDMMIFDFDPSPGVPWAETLRAARELRARLEDLELPAFPRITGGKGLHIVVPLEPRADWDEVRDFAKALAVQQARDDPKRLTANLSKAKRRGKVFIDYLRNGRSNTAVASYSARAREGAPVAVPLRWDELGAATRPDRYNIENLRRRLGALKEDPWEGFFDARATLTAKMRKAVGMK